MSLYPLLGIKYKLIETNKETLCGTKLTKEAYEKKKTFVKE